MDGNTLFEQALNSQRQVASFLIRLTQDMWKDENGEPRVQWRGHINHVQGEDEAAFTDFAEAVSFIQQKLADMTLKSIPGELAMEQEKVLRESFKLWEQFALSYSNLMIEAMERTIAQSQTIRDQMSGAVERMIRVSRGGEQSVSEETQTLLEELQDQVQALSQKVDQIEKGGK